MNKIPKKNYILLGVITVLTVLLVLYVNSWIRTYKENHLELSPLVDNINQVNKNELHMSLAESNQIILYVGFNHSENIMKFEKALLKNIKNKNLVEYILYYNVTDELEDEEYLGTLKEEFPEIKGEINKAPMLIYVKNGTAEKAIDSKTNLITINDFTKLINDYKIGQ